jgi:hypothetical protein
MRRPLKETGEPAIPLIEGLLALGERKRASPPWPNHGHSISSETISAHGCSSNGIKTPHDLRMVAR